MCIAWNVSCGGNPVSFTSWPGLFLGEYFPRPRHTAQTAAGKQKRLACKRRLYCPAWYHA